MSEAAAQQQGQGAEQAAAGEQQQGSLIPTPGQQAPAGEQTAEPTTPAKAPEGYDWRGVHERFHVVGEGGEPDLAATLEKVNTSYRELEGKLGSKPQPGEDGKVHYDLSVPDGIEAIVDPKSEQWSAFEEVFAELNLSQAQVDKLVRAQSEVFAAENMIDAGAEREALTKQGYDEAKLGDFANFFASRLSGEDFQELQAYAQTADFLVFMDRAIRPLVHGTKIPADLGGEPTNPGKVTRASIEERYKNPLQHENSDAGEQFQRETLRLAGMVTG